MLPKRIEARAKHSRAPTQGEYLDAAFRDRTRNAYSARFKLWSAQGWNEAELRESFSPEDLAFLDADSEEQQAKDAGVMQRYERAHGTEGEDVSGIAARVREKLRGMTRIGRPG